jgi:hypothetical protein
VRLSFRAVAGKRTPAPTYEAVGEYGRMSVVESPKKWKVKADADNLILIIRQIEGLSCICRQEIFGSGCLVSKLILNVLQLGPVRTEENGCSISPGGTTVRVVAIINKSIIRIRVVWERYHVRKIADAWPTWSDIRVAYDLASHRKITSAHSDDQL